MTWTTLALLVAGFILIPLFALLVSFAISIGWYTGKSRTDEMIRRHLNECLQQELLKERLKKNETI